MKSDQKSSVVVTNYLERDIQDYFLSATEANVSIFHTSNSILCADRFDFKEWVSENSGNYIMDSGDFILAYFKVGTAIVRMEAIVNNGTNVRFELWGEKSDVKAMEKTISQLGFKKDDDDVEISWVFTAPDGDIQSFDVPLLIPEPINGAYPWLNTSVENYAKNYISSTASVLILIGPPGTGKTTFIKEMIKASKKNTMVTYDTKLLFQDSFFASFMSGHEDLLVLEDADEIMGSRKDGNSLMHRFLSASDGLVSGKGKKIIFTTNLPSIKDVDPALVRPGRCYDVISTRKLDLGECEDILEGLDREDLFDTLPKDRDLSLAEVFALINKKEEERFGTDALSKKRIGNPVGFLG